MMGRPRLKIDTAEYTRMYLAGVSTVDLAKHFKISESSSNNVRVSLDLPVRRRRVKFDEKEYRRLFDEGVTYPEMAKKLRISRLVVMKVRKKPNLSNRKRGRKTVLR